MQATPLITRIENSDSESCTGVAFTLLFLLALLLKAIARKEPRAAEINYFLQEDNLIPHLVINWFYSLKSMSLSAITQNILKRYPKSPVKEILIKETGRGSC
jgi:hypothetical protein